MSKLNLQLPTIQNWNCHNCGGCCKQHGIFITEEEKLRIESQQWTPVDGIPADQPIFVKMGGMFEKSWHRLAHQADGGCVFLDEKGLCKIHGKFGEAAKPLACRIYPYAFHPAGSKVTLSLRFSCPSVADNLGRSVTSQRAELKQIAKLVVPENVGQAKAPAIRSGITLDWSDTLQIVQSLDDTFATDAKVSVKLLRALSWISLIEQTNFATIRGQRLRELLQLITEATTSEIQNVSSEVAPPSKIGRVQFRLLAGQYARKDTYASADATWLGRVRMLKYAFKLTSGKGTLPPLQAELKPLAFETLENSYGVIPEQSEEMLSRYFRVKLQGIHFCGPAYYNVPLVEGFNSLALVYPVTLWLARWIAASNNRYELLHADIREALTIADHHHGYSPAFGTWGFRRRVKTLMNLEDIPKFIRWYSE